MPTASETRAGPFGIKMRAGRRGGSDRPPENPRSRPKRTSAVAAKTLGRRFVGFDVSPTYLEVASRKIAQVEDAGVDEETPTER